MFLKMESSGRNKSQKSISPLFEDGAFCRLLIAFPLKMYSKSGRPKWILKLVGKWPAVISSTGEIYHDLPSSQPRSTPQVKLVSGC